jgi:hypothetical protein
MKIYRLYYLEQEYIPSDYVDEDGYVDDYYDDYIDHDITLGYFANTKAMDKWIEEHEDNDGNIVEFVDKKFDYVCYDEDLQCEEIEVIE